MKCMCQLSGIRTEQCDNICMGGVDLKIWCYRNRRNFTSGISVNIHKYVELLIQICTIQHGNWLPKLQTPADQGTSTKTGLILSMVVCPLNHLREDSMNIIFSREFPLLAKCHNLEKNVLYYKCSVRKEPLYWCPDRGAGLCLDWCFKKSSIIISFMVFLYSVFEL